MKLKKSSAVERNPRCTSEETQPDVPRLPELVAQIATRNRYQEVKTGRARGNELLSVLQKLKPLEEDFSAIEDPIPLAAHPRSKKSKKTTSGATRH